MTSNVKMMQITVPGPNGTFTSQFVPAPLSHYQRASNLLGTQPMNGVFIVKVYACINAIEAEVESQNQMNDDQLEALILLLHAKRDCEQHMGISNVLYEKW